MVTAAIPDCTVATGGVKGQAEYLLPLTALSAFPALFKVLDVNKWSYGLTQTTLEEAYLNIETWGPGVHQGADTIDNNALRQWEALSVKPPAQPSIFLQFAAVFRKRVRSIQEDRKSWLSLVLLPLVVLVFVLTIKSQSIAPPLAPHITPALSLFDDHRLTATFPLQLPFVLAAGYTLTALNRTPSHPFTATNSQGVQILAPPNPLSRSTSARGDWEGEEGSTLAGVVKGTALLLPEACGQGCLGALVLGDPGADKDIRVEQAAMHAVLFYNSSLFPSTVLLLAWAGALALPAGGAFLPSFCPFPLLVGEVGVAMGGVEEAMVAELADVDISSSLTTFFALVMHTVVMERVSGLKHQQLLAGCQPLAYWAAHLAMDGLSFALVVLGMTLVMLLWGVDVVRSAVTLHSYILLMCLYGVALTALLYALASVFKSPGAAQYAVVVLMSVGSLIIRGIVSALQASPMVDGTTKQVAEALQFIDPNVALAKGLDRLTIALQVSQARDASEEPSAPFHPLSWEEGVGKSLVALVLSALLFLGWCARAEMQLMLLRPTPMPVTDAMGKEKEELGEEDEDVAEERTRTRYAPRDQLYIHNFRKVYGTKVALKDLCLRVAPCSTFCLLGSNGAGKTTLLSMLTGSLSPSAGIAMVGETTLNGPSASLSRTAKVLSYCPQANQLHESLSVRQHLFLYAALGGLTEVQVAPLVDGYLGVLGLAGQADHLALNLSGGNKRRLMLAIALVRDPRVLLLDEPTAGLDPRARRQVVEVLQRWRTTGQRSILLTTHLMEVCRALADRIGILVQGELVCLGRLAHLQSKFGDYLQLDLVAPNTEPTDLLAYMRQQLVAKVTLLEHHRGYYTLRIPKDGTSLAVIFSTLELARAAGRILEYGVQAASLEHIFLGRQRALED
jgi:ABC-type multidrug transport system ATPase subunit